MKTRVFPSILVATSIFSLYSTPPIDWERVGENWGTSLHHGKKNIKRLTGQTINESLRLDGQIHLDAVLCEKHVTCYGYAHLNTVTVKGVTTMFGPLIATNSTFADLDVRCHNEAAGKGIVKLSDCTLNKMTLDGQLEATNLTANTLTTYAADMHLSYSTVQTVTCMNSALPRNEKAIIQLDNTVVEGSITFTKKGGVVICKGNAVVRGTIINGTLIRR